MQVTKIEDQGIAPQKKVELFFNYTSSEVSFCPFRDVLDRIGDKWSLLAIVTIAHFKVIRFNQLKNNIKYISQRMLVITLRSLEEDGLVTRRVYAEVPPRVEYQLTKMGNSLLIQVLQMAEWATANGDKIIKIRKRSRKVS